MEPTSSPDPNRQSRGLSRFWPGSHGSAAPGQRESDEDGVDDTVIENPPGSFPSHSGSAQAAAAAQLAGNSAKVQHGEPQMVALGSRRGDFEQGPRQWNGNQGGFPPVDADRAQQNGETPRHGGAPVPNGTSSGGQVPMPQPPRPAFGSPPPPFGQVNGNGGTPSTPFTPATPFAPQPPAPQPPASQPPASQPAASQPLASQPPGSQLPGSPSSAPPVQPPVQPSTQAQTPLAPQPPTQVPQSLAPQPPIQPPAQPPMTPPVQSPIQPSTQQRAPQQPSTAAQPPSAVQPPAPPARPAPLPPLPPVAGPTPSPTTENKTEKREKSESDEGHLAIPLGSSLTGGRRRAADEDEDFDGEIDGDDQPMHEIAHQNGSNGRPATGWATVPTSGIPSLAKQPVAPVAPPAPTPAQRRSASLEDADSLPRAGRPADATPTSGGPLRPGDVTLGQISFWDEEAITHFRQQWHEVKGDFVDDPVSALTRAHDLLTEAVNELTEALLAERDELDPLDGKTTPDTESMRMAMRGYREFLDRILAL
ncbi:hypothetical protein [Actinoplanes sp. NBRC 103695]|uniref:hypothetical protein n=1 Tax=Actinoplanes sp. NBRC 103695 TaxID=3032202 RepID=UPI0024A43A1B|nr:hypothetical protein [Actinoplanes sp. NBRC 103695]GLY93525.1 hypothetical protein Acsp02_07810 [Actinoplanes sp. NBRC 103695]